MSDQPHTDWLDRFPELQNLSAADRAILSDHAMIVELPAGQTVFAPGKKPEHFLLLLEGTVRVQQAAANGREIILYRVSGGESCIMTTACLLSDEDYLAEGITETAVSAVAISKSAFDDLVGRSAAFRRLVFAKYASRMTDLQRLVENVAFERVNKRLAQKLLELTSGRRQLDMTHQELATELGTAREVISRLMKDFAGRGWVSGGRGHVEILDRDALAAMAQDA